MVSVIFSKKGHTKILVNFDDDGHNLSEPLRRSQYDADERVLALLA